MLRIIPQTVRLPILSSCYKKTAAASVQLQIRQAHAKRKKTPPPKHLTRYIPPRSIRRPPPSRRSSAPVVYTHTNLKVAIVGRPNVGKSTLFNRLAGAVRGRGNEGVANPSPLVFVRSVVDSVPGVTRDPREASGALSDLLLTVVDTPGLENAVGDSIPANVDVASGKEHVKLASASALCENPFYRQMYNQMEEKTVEAVAAADVVFFVIDASDGVTSIDKAISSWLHCSIKDTGKRVMVIANKCDVKDSEKRVTDAYELGFGDPMVLSAEQGFGFADLYAEMDRIQLEIRQETGQSTIQGYENPWNTDNSEEIKIHDPKKEEELSAFDDELVVAYRDRPGEEPLKQLVVSIAGRPNVGKSTLLNRLAGENRSLVGPEAGVTRDAVLCKWPVPDEWLAKRVKENHGRDAEVPPLWLVDTAGVRAQTKVLEEKLELLSVKTSLRALRHSHVVVMVLDACEPLVMQDAKIMDLVVTEGRATVLVVNKMDKLGITDKKELDEWKMQLRYIVDKRLSDVSGVEIVEMSAKKWEEDPDQMKRLFDAVCTAWSKWEKRIPTAHLNRFVQGFNERMAVGGGTKGTKRNRIGVTKFITQKKIRPPMFRLDGSSAVSLNYLRSLTNAIRLEFGFQGIPIRVKRPIRGRK